MFLESLIIYFFFIISLVLLGTSSAVRTLNKFEIKNYYVKESFFSVEIFLAIFIFSVISGIRFNVGVDYPNYLENFNYFEYTGKEEYLFFFISDLCWFFNLHYSFYFTIIAFLQIFFLYYTFNRERYLLPFLILFLFLCGQYLSMMNIMRQSIAMCIWLYSLKFVAHRHFYKYIFFCLIAFLFHKSAIILVIFYFILNREFILFKNVFFQIGLLLLALFARNYFNVFLMNIEGVINFYTSILGAELYESYSMDNIKDDIKEGGSGLAFLFKLFLNFIIIINSNKLKSFFNSKIFNMYYFLFFLGLFFSYILPIGVVAIARPFSYFNIFVPIVYSYAAYYLFYNRKYQYNLFFLFLFLFANISVFILYLYSSDLSNNASYALFQFYFLQ